MITPVAVRFPHAAVSVTSTDSAAAGVYRTVTSSVSPASNGMLSGVELPTRTEHPAGAQPSVYVFAAVPGLRTRNASADSTSTRPSCLPASGVTSGPSRWPLTVTAIACVADSVPVVTRNVTLPVPALEPARVSETDCAPTPTAFADSVASDGLAVHPLTAPDATHEYATGNSTPFGFPTWTATCPVFGRSTVAWLGAWTIVGGLSGGGGGRSSSTAVLADPDRVVPSSVAVNRTVPDPA